MKLLLFLETGPVRLLQTIQGKQNVQEDFRPDDRPTFQWQRTMSTIAVLQDIEAGRDGWDLPIETLIGFFERYLSGSVKSIVMEVVSFYRQTAGVQEGLLMSYPANFSKLLEKFATEDNIATISTDIWAF